MGGAPRSAKQANLSLAASSAYGRLPGATLTAAARSKARRPIRYLVTFQGYELYSTFSRSIHREKELYAKLVEAVSQSDWPAIAVSDDYLARVVEDIGLSAEALRAIPPGVPSATPMDRAKAEQTVKAKFLEYRSGVPLISYLVLAAWVCSAISDMRRAWPS